MIPKEVLVVAFIAVIVFYYVGKYFTERSMQKKEDSSSSTERNKVSHSAEDCAEGGCGMRAVCAGKVERLVEYFEDEELDRFKERAADGYSADEIAEFREVLVTLRGDEVAPWLNSLCARNINLPLPLRQEAIALVNKNKK